MQATVLRDGAISKRARRRGTRIVRSRESRRPSPNQGLAIAPLRYHDRAIVNRARQR